MSSNDITIQVKNLSKCYNIYNRPQDRLKQSVIPRLQRLVGRPANRYFREFWALRGVSFDVRKGETVGIIGRNGSGKSTLLQIICGTLSPTSGIVTTRGRITALLELGSGFNPDFSGRENVYLNGAILGLSKQEVDARFDDIAGFADIGEFIEQPVKIYSSGMAVRLAFAVQAMVDPDILVVDEALAVGDEKFQRKCFARIEELKSKGTSILFVSHSGPQIVELCDRALLLEQGERLMFNQPLRVVRAYQKLIYAPAEEYKKLLQEYRIADTAKISPERTEERISDTNVPVSASFDPGLVPETTEVYPIQGAEILSYQILDNDRRPVNILTLGQNYQFEVSGQFLENRDNVYFGFHVRALSGVIVTAQRYPEPKNFIDQVRAGENFRITYGLKMSLLPGVYFIGTGVWSLREPSCLHRVMDALMFRVSPEKNLKSSGYVDLASAEPLLEIF
ncbi:MAG: ABC transporter ATP-binding protein [Anaerolineales bacterium]